MSYSVSKEDSEVARASRLSEWDKRKEMEHWYILKWFSQMLRPHFAEYGKGGAELSCISLEHHGVFWPPARENCDFAADNLVSNLVELAVSRRTSTQS